jgi:RNA polymerase sigma-70 factor, ECF subfamily
MPGLAPETLTAPADDRELAAAVAAGDESALAEVYLAHAAPVYALARRIVGAASDAEDVVQEVFLGFWNRPEAFDGDRASLRTYLLLRARTASLDLVRAREARARREEHDGARRPVDADPAEVVSDRFDRSAVGALVDVLKPAEREAIELAYYGGLTYKEIARKVGVPENTIKSRVRLGVERMRRATERTEELDRVG